MNCRIVEINDLKDIGRIIVLSDIHGYVHYLDKVLEKADYSVQDTVVILEISLKKGQKA